jgi:hypothetical protein
VFEGPVLRGSKSAVGVVSKVKGKTRTAISKPKDRSPKSTIRPFYEFFRGIKNKSL